MALNLGRLFFQLGADVSGLTKAEKQAQNFANNTEKSFKRVSKSVKLLGGVITGALTFGAAKSVLTLADEYNILQVRIKTATEASGNYLKVSKELFRISNANGTALRTNVQLFQGLARASEDLGATEQDMLQLTEAVGQLGIIGGSTATQIDNALLQFTQGLSGGVFRAEEFNSLIENMPELAKRIADGFGVTSGQLRQMVIKGTVLSKDVFRAIQGQSKQIAEDFSKIPLSLSRTSVALKNSVAKFLAGLTNSFQLTQKIARTFQNIANYLGDLDSEQIARIAYFLELSVKHAVALGTAYLAFKAGAVLVRLYRISLQRTTVAFKLFRSQAIASGASVKGLAGAFTTAKIAARGFGLALKGIFAATGIGLLVVVLGELGLALYELLSDVEKRLAFAKRFNLEWNTITTGFNVFSKDLILGWTIMNKAIFKLMGAVRIRWIRLYNALFNIVVTSVSNFNGLVEKFFGKNKRLDDFNKKLQKIQSENLKNLANANSKNSETNNLKQIEIDKARMIRDLAGEKRDLAFAELEAHKNKNEVIDKEIEKEEILKKIKITKGAGGVNIVDQLSLDQRAEALKTGFSLEFALTDAFFKTKEDMYAEHNARINKIQLAGSLIGLSIHQKGLTEEQQQQSDLFKSQIDELSGHSKAFFEIKKALAVASALVEAPKAVLSSYTFGASIGGPFLGATFAGIAAAATATQVAGILSANFSGGRQFGGGVSPNGLYRVNENGPEMLSTAGKDYLMMGNSPGKVTPNGGFGSSANVTVNIKTLPGETARTTQSQNENGTEIDVIIEKIEGRIAQGIADGNSPISNQVEATYGFNRSSGALV